MKFIHTADWHLGKTFYEHDLLQDQKIVLEQQFLPLIDREKPDVVLLAGDVYDRAVPPPEAIKLFDEIACAISLERRIPFVVVSGNHDSGVRLSSFSRVLEREGVFIMGSLEQLHVIPIDDEAGTVYIVPLPYAESADIREYVGDRELKGRSEVMRAYSEYLLEGVPNGARKIAVAHDYIAGGVPSKSERRLMIGNAELLSADIFSDYNYAALGHLHGIQPCGAQNYRYSGSLLKYSFDEEKQQKCFIVGEMDADGTVKLRNEMIRPPRDVRVLRGTFEEICAQDPGTEDFIEARIAIPQGGVMVINATEKLRRFYPNICHTVAENKNTQCTEGINKARRKVGMLEMLREYVRYGRSEPLSSEETAYVTEIVARVSKNEGDANI